MDFKQRASDWANEAKIIKRDKPDDKDLAAKTTDVQGALLKLEQAMGPVENATEDLRKKLAAAVLDAEKASKACDGFDAAAKKASYVPLESQATEKDLDEFLKAAKELKAALGKFDKKTD